MKTNPQFQEIKEQIDKADFSYKQLFKILIWMLIKPSKFYNLIDKLKNGMIPLIAFKQSDNEQK